MIKAGIPWNCKQIHKMVGYNSLIFDNAMQRGYVWDKKRQSLLIDSILRNYPIPPFYTIKTDEKVHTPRGDASVFDAIDGKQRCLTITRFKNNELVLTGLSEPIIDEDGNEIDLNGKTYDTLSDSLKDAFDSYSLTVYYFMDITDKEITEMMARLNNGKPLSTTENIRIKAKDLSGLRKLTMHPLFTENFTEKAIDSYKTEDTVIKMYMIANGMTSLDNKDVRPVYQNLIITPETANDMNAIFDYIISVHKHLMDNHGKRTAHKMTMRTHLISITAITQRAIAENQKVEDVAAMLDQFFGDGKPSDNEDYNIACKNGSNHQTNVEARLKALNDEYDWYFKKS